jgi:predicted aldo/keto reductase-like oxidoreductase
MKYRRFGRTGLQMPVFSCGGMRYQHKWQDVDPKEIPPGNQANLEATIRRAVELGIYHIETARGYGSSEMQLGRILPTLSRDEIIVQTKIGPKASTREFLDTFETSMRYLRLDYVDLLALHGINHRQFLDWSLRKNGCLAAARQIQREGRCRFVGFSTHATTDIILETINQGDFDYVNLHWYFVNDLNWPCLEGPGQDMGCSSSARMTRAENSTSRRNWSNSRTAFADAIQCAVLPGPPGSSHTELQRPAKPADFDEHVAL